MTHTRSIALALVLASAAGAQTTTRTRRPPGTTTRKPATPAAKPPAKRPAARPTPDSVGRVAKAQTVAESKSLAQADAEFAQRVAQAGFKNAMLPALADDAVLFMPRAVPGRTWLASSPVPEGSYSWSPAWSALSAAGDLGLTTGPIAFHSTSPDTSSTGQYVTLWTRTPLGWKIRLHLVVPGPQVPAVTYAPHQPPGDGRPRGGPGAVEASRATLFIADRALFTAAANDGLATALLRVATPDVRVLRGATLPAVGIDSARASLGREAVPNVVWQTAGDLYLARSGDLGVTYGMYERRTASGRITESGNFVRAWERQPDGGWRVLLDALSPNGPR